MEKIKGKKSFYQKLKSKMGDMEVSRTLKIVYCIVMIIVISLLIVNMPRIVKITTGVTEKDITLSGNIIECKDECEGLNKIFGVHVYTVVVNVDNTIYTCNDKESYYRCKNIDSNNTVTINGIVSSNNETDLKSIEEVK